jgi:DNA processing protein
VKKLAHLTPLDERYPSRLRQLDDAPASITIGGGDVEASHAVAVVGSRRATLEAAQFARELAGALAAAGAVVVSGGALGIDAAAHQGALEAKGRTWVVAATGHEQCCPATHAPLFSTIAKGPGAMIWPFAPRYMHRSGFLARNRILVALADAVVVVQAGWPSGALHAASWARKLKKPLWVVPVPPWAPWPERFRGSHRLLDEGARPLTAIDVLLRSLGLAAADTTDRGGPHPMLTRALSADESAVLAIGSSVPLHTDAIAARAGLSPQATAFALLTLALEDVVVEGPPGFFRRQDAHNR